jgi:hypothetical protein
MVFSDLNPLKNCICLNFVIRRDPKILIEFDFSISFGAKNQPPNLEPPSREKSLCEPRRTKLL